jgi:methionine sulfoxide reductase catalytic subunit
MDKNGIRNGEPKSSEITPEALYLNRREFMKFAGAVALATTLAACGVNPTSQPAAQPTSATGTAPGSAATSVPKTGADELGAPFTSYQDITSYNNYYEFSMSKDFVAKLAQKFQTSPWNVEISGLVQNPKTYAIEDLVKQFPPQERIYRMRCVEAWSMVIPWEGFALGDLIKQAGPTGNAKFVRFTSVDRPQEMPGQNDSGLPWPYTEGLRLDEALHPLTILATGLYGKSLLGQNGAPLRLVVPWKYGFKSAKSIVKIELVAEQPATFWETLGPDEYGFYSNVNPNHSHPRWSQASERRIGELSRRQTLMFNGYGEQVAALYSGMDLDQNY